jgi:hypothetical protein
MITGLISKTLSVIDDSSNSELIFHCTDGTKFRMYHSQDCCESVELEDIVGDLSDIIGSPILDAREETNSGSDPEDLKKDNHDDTFTWTFYIITTAKGTVTLRWLGESNGYYSESVDFDLIGQAS